MINRDEIRQELILREHVRGAIKVVKGRRDKRRLLEQKNETQLRAAIRELLAEGQSAVASVARHDNTGINALEDLLKNTNILFVIQTGYKSLTTRTKEDPKEGQTRQRRSYENHILSAVKKSLAPEESRKEAGEDVEITEDIDIDIKDKPEDDPDFIDVEEEEVEEVEVDEKEEFGINGEDKTGRNRAFTDFAKIEKDILTAFDDLDNPQDLGYFEEYLIKNLALYFEKYENELSDQVEAPPEAVDAAPDDPGDVEADVGVPVDDDLGAGLPDDISDEETHVPGFELQEAIRYLNIDDILKNLL